MWINYYIAINILLFVLFFIDKGKAQLKAWRIKENTLLLIGILGGGFGGFLGMYCFRHKTRKLKFKIIYVLSLVLHVCVLKYFLKVF